MTAAPRRFPTALVLLLLVAGAGVAAYFTLLPPPATTAPTAELTLPPEPPEATGEEVHRLCAACHAYPPPDTFPRSAWRKEVKPGYDFFHQDPSYRFAYPHLEAVVRYYEKRAPKRCRRFRRRRPSSRRSGSTATGSARRRPARRASRTSASSSCSARTTPTSSSATPAPASPRSARTSRRRRGRCSPATSAAHTPRSWTSTGTA